MHHERLGFTATNVPLKLVEKPDPVATEGRVIIDEKAADLCHSDVGALRDEKWMNIIEKKPIIMGHEVADVVSEVGEGVTDFKIGDRVGVCPVSLVGMGTGYGYGGGIPYSVLISRLSFKATMTSMNFCFPLFSLKGTR